MLRCARTFSCTTTHEARSFPDRLLKLPLSAVVKICPSSLQATPKQSAEQCSATLPNMHGQFLPFQVKFGAALQICFMSTWHSFTLSVLAGVEGHSSKASVQARQQGGFIHVACSPCMSQQHVPGSKSGQGEESFNATAWAVDTALRSISTGQTALLWWSSEPGVVLDFDAGTVKLSAVGC